MMYLYFRSQQIKAKQQMQQEQIAAITGIDPPSSPLGGIIDGIITVISRGIVSNKN